MTEPKPPQKPSLGERLEDLISGLLETLEGLVAPEPALVPVPTRGRPPRRARR